MRPPPDGTLRRWQHTSGHGSRVSPLSGQSQGSRRFYCNDYLRSVDEDDDGPILYIFKIVAKTQIRPNLNRSGQQIYGVLLFSLLILVFQIFTFLQFILNIYDIRLGYRL